MSYRAHLKKERELFKVSDQFLKFRISFFYNLLLFDNHYLTIFQNDHNMSFIYRKLKKHILLFSLKLNFFFQMSTDSSLSTSTRDGEKFMTL